MGTEVIQVSWDFKQLCPRVPWDFHEIIDREREIGEAQNDV